MDCSATGIAMLHTFLKKAQLCLIFSCYLKANTTSISTGGIHGIKGKEVFYMQGEQQPDIFYISLLQTTPANAGVATGERGYMERAMATRNHFIKFSYGRQTFLQFSLLAFCFHSTR